MYPLATAFPFLRRLHIPLERDQWILLLAAANEIFLGIDIDIAHHINGIKTASQWIPIYFGLAAGIVLLVAGLVAQRKRMLANFLGSLIFLGSMLVGILGTYYHFRFTLLPAAPPGEQLTVDLLIWAPPLLGPFYFFLVGVLGLSAAWQEDPAGSGILHIFSGHRLHMPFSKFRAYFLLVSLGILATLLSSVMDHAQTNFSNPWLWLPTAAGTFAAVVALGIGLTRQPARADLVIFSAAMLLLLVVGLTGEVLHITKNLTEQGQIVGERFLHGAPFLAPLLFANMGLLGLLVMLPPSQVTQPVEALSPA